MDRDKAEDKLNKKKQQETLEISTTGYGLESALASDDWGNNLSAQKQNETESSWTES
jgi:hypothetical protein